MKKLAISLSLFLFWYSSPTPVAQVAPQKAILIDSFKKPGCELLLNRLDYLAFEASKHSGSVGFIVLYPSINIFENAAYERAIKNNSAFRRFPEGLVRSIWSTRKDELSFELWRGWDSNPPPIREVPFDYYLPNISTRIRFVEDSVEVFKFAEKLEYVSASCVNEFSLAVLSAVLLANPDLSAEIIIFNRKSRDAGKLSRLILDAAISENGIRRDKLKITYGGKGRAKEWSSDISAIGIWLLPIKHK